MPAPPPPRRRTITEHLWAYGFLAPVIVILGVFKIFPAFYAFYISLFRWDIIQGAFRGLGNYGDILYENPTRAEAFWRSLSTTLTKLATPAAFTRTSYPAWVSSVPARSGVQTPAAA